MSTNTDGEAPTGAKSGTIVIAIIVPSVLIILLLTLIIMSVSMLLSQKTLCMSKLTAGIVAEAFSSHDAFETNLNTKKSAGRRGKTNWTLISNLNTFMIGSQARKRSVLMHHNHTIPCGE
jgi:flagellar basal body-associated protein FliL